MIIDDERLADEWLNDDVTIKHNQRWWSHGMQYKKYKLFICDDDDVEIGAFCTYKSVNIKIQTKRGPKADTFLQKGCWIFRGQEMCLFSMQIAKSWTNNIYTLNWPQLNEIMLRTADHFKLSKVISVEASTPLFWIVILTRER